MPQHVLSIFRDTFGVYQLCFGKFKKNFMAEVMANQQRSITLPEGVWAEIDELAIMQPGELTRELILRGLRAYKAELATAMSYENKQLVNQKLKQRQGDMADALEVIKLIETSSAPEPDELRDAIATLERGLSD